MGSEWFVMLDWQFGRRRRREAKVTEGLGGHQFAHKMMMRRKSSSGGGMQFCLEHCFALCLVDDPVPRLRHFHFPNQSKQNWRPLLLKWPTTFLKLSKNDVAFQFQISCIAVLCAPTVISPSIRKEKSTNSFHDPFPTRRTFFSSVKWANTFSYFFYQFCLFLPQMPKKH